MNGASNNFFSNIYFRKNKIIRYKTAMNHTLQKKYIKCLKKQLIVNLIIQHISGSNNNNIYFRKS